MLMGVRKGKNGVRRYTAKSRDGQRLTCLAKGQMIVVPLSSLPPQMRKALEQDRIDREARISKGGTK